ncbi:hypothetical protein [Niabella drilacis]|uniref:Uncharacterized protein n=1 Tax=Niabella drilacis (strain DSM 25811 / CCM 8410 / CCUG 62505 / LMG 26954 / E90) TaxID=1285928 RepID=A0A1G6TUG5_NIADE|nr:hypothetical protein [Niabella drilacis]SDD32738.1 hypothetical protein SAMN04487894_10839 [Niabella drilacis]
MTKHGFYVLSLCFFLTIPGKGQNPVLTINNSNIATEVAVSNNTFTANSCLLALGAYVRVRANADFSPTLTPSILSKIKLLITAIGPNVSLGSSVTERSLSTSDQALYSALISLVSGGAVTIRYRLPQTEMINYAWKAGTYTANLTFTTPGGALCLGAGTYPASLTVIVNPFMVASTPANITATLDNLNYFRNTALSSSHSLPFTYTVPLGLRVKTAAANFAYSNGYPGAANPNTSTNNVSANVSAPVSGSGIALSSSYQNLSPAGGYTIPIGNKQTNTINYTLSPAQLRSGFIQKGTYTTTLNYEAFDAGTTPRATAIQQASALTINVADLGELRVNNSDVTVSFSSLNDYKNGVSTSLNNALTVSKTTPYDIYVKASSSNLVNGSNTIPVSCISISSGTGDPSVSTITLSPTAQKIISASAPVIDRQVGLQYSVPPDKVSQVLGKPPGTYSTTVTYSFVAP